MLKYIGTEKQTYTKVRQKEVAFSVIPGQSYDFGELNEAMLETGKFVKIEEDIQKMVVEDKKVKKMTKENQD